MCFSSGKSEKQIGKIVTVLNQAPEYEDIFKSGGIAPHILNVSTLRSVAIFTTFTTLSTGKELLVPIL
jgi:hypothetical protein